MESRKERFVNNESDVSNTQTQEGKIISDDEVHQEKKRSHSTTENFNKAEGSQDNLSKRLNAITIIPKK